MAVRLDPAEVDFVLVEPQGAGNVGSAARALKNTGFRRMVLVSPRCDPHGAEAKRMAVSAADLLEAARIERDLDRALAQASTVIGTSRRSGKHRRPHWRLDRFGDELAGLARRGPLAILFGREDSGLTDEELDRCTHLVSLPGAEGYPSFNLSQAVLLVAYTLRLEGGMAGDDADAVDPPAPHRQREAMMRHLERALLSIGFLTPQTAPVIMRRLRRLIGRASASSDDVATLRGLARQILWSASRAGLSIPSEHPAERETGPDADEER